MQQLVPVGYDPEAHLSASYREAIGTIYLTLHPQPMTMTEALIHEFSHNKLNALFELDPVLDNAFWPLYASPVRPDPRPLHGVLLAAHAFVPVAEMYFRMIDQGAPETQTHGFDERLRQIVAKNHDALTVLEARGLEVPAKVRKVVLSCTDLAQLDAWVRAAVTTPRAEALLTPATPSPSARKTRSRRPV